MPALELHFFAADDPNGSTIFECSTDDQFLKEVKLDIQRDSLGSGEVSFARKVPAGGLFNRGIIEPEVLVRVLIPSVHATKYLHGFFINPRQQQVVSRDEKGGEGFTFAGPGPKHYLERMLLWSASFSGYDNAVEKENGIWTWPSTARAGAILNRLILEDQDNPSGPFLPDLTISFSDSNDSASVAWTDDIAGNADFTLKIQDDYLKILWILEDAAGFTTQIDLGEVGDPLLQLDAYQTFGRDLTGAIGASTVHFTEGVNIATDLDVEGSSYKKATHALVKGEDGVYELAVHPSGTAWKKVVPTSYSSSNNTVLDQAGRRFLQRQDFGEKQIKLRIVPGFDPANGLYMPGPDGTDGHFWPGDTVSLTTGQGAGTALDYASEDQAVTGIELELEEAVRDDTDLQAARSFIVTAILNEERQSSNTSRDLAGNRGAATGPVPLKLCPALTVGEVSTTFRYFSSDNSNPAGLAVSAGWNVDSAGADFENNELTTTPDGTYSATSHSSSTGGGGGSVVDVCLTQHIMLLDTDTAAVIAAGGATIKAYAQCRARSGVGITESAQQLISQMTVRVTQGNSTTIRGTALALHGLAFGPAAGEIWPASNATRNRIFPPAAGSNVLSAVSGAASGDYLVIELGYRNFTVPAATGGTIFLNADPAVADLPDDGGQGASNNEKLNSWVQISADSGSSGRGNHPDLVGEGTAAARCDHSHHIVSDRAPTTADNTDAGYPVTTLWTNTETGQLWLLTDADAGTWQQLNEPGHSHDETDPTRVWEAVTDGEDVFVWEGDDLVHEWRDYP